ncbi:BnaA10g10480D [Brassica napus]|uniref:BnaA10g10480D protein n=1 Tax=Brassica napus TaxID=3708 RepID=A0A078H4L3_BRANA|nr:BnaA10g10480D [Brassica napus]
MATKPNGKSPVSSASDEKVMFFRDVSLGPHETQLRFRLIHFWEAWNPIKKTLIGLEMLLIDEQGTVIQGFISPSRIEKYLGKMERGKVYKLDNFYGSSNKSVYRVSDHAVTVSFSWNSELSELQNITTPFDEDRFRFHSYEVFEANCDLKGDLYDVVGHMKLVNGHTLTESPVLDEVQIAAARHLLFEFLKWDFRNNTGTLALTSMSSSRVFMDYDVQPTIDYFGWLSSNPAIAEQVDAEVVTKRETMTIGELFSYIKQKSAKEAFFECTATIDDVVHGYAWYYISCSGCHSKVTKGPTSLICTNNKCGKVNVDGVPQYMARLSVYDNSEQAVFVLLGDAGRALTGKHASELVSNYFEANANEGVDQEVPVPEALINTIGQSHKFCVKVTKHNLSGKTRALTVTKILPLDTPTETETSAGTNISATSNETSQTGNDVCESSKSRVGAADAGSKRSCDNAKVEKAKRPKSGK